jgi:hypothetical protein
MLSIDMRSGRSKGLELRRHGRIQFQGSQRTAKSTPEVRILKLRDGTTHAAVCDAPSDAAEPRATPVLQGQACGPGPTPFCGPLDGLLQHAPTWPSRCGNWMEPGKLLVVFTAWPSPPRFIISR